ncbi:MAG TPA: PEP-CTERM sorting domain-containing protein [Chthonomonadaceae bacterium]|nr:PEP-CTERM sorting domain-containing protein [Chthonomonadaceae bacterium]
MKWPSLLALAAGLLLWAGTASAQTPPTVLITVDENGTGTGISPQLGFTFFPAFLAPDPGPGGLDSVLTYDLLGPPDLVAGDVLLFDEGISANVLDVIRFNPAGTGGDPNYPASLLFYSDDIEGFDSLADTDSPPGAFYSNQVSIPEVGPEDNNGAFYTPTANQPGFVPGFAVTYHFISDAAVPEPGALALLLTSGLTGTGLLLRRRVRK